MNIFFLLILSTFVHQYEITDAPKIEFQVTKDLYLEESAVGKATHDPIRDIWVVEIDEDSFNYNKNNPKVIELIIYHELGHVLLHLHDTHDDTFMNPDNLDVPISDKEYKSLKKL